MGPNLWLHRILNPLFFKLRNALRISRHNYRETPSKNLPSLSPAQKKRITTLQEKYRIDFASRFNETNTRDNYTLLDLLDQFSAHWVPTPNQVVVDVGSKNFVYAEVLEAFLHPKQLTGVEIDAYQLYQDGHTRASYAQFYLRDLPHFRYLTGDYLQQKLPCDGITMLYPFVTAEPLLRWQLPLACLQPAQLFAQVFANTATGGWMLMTNHWSEEWDIATREASAAGWKLQKMIRYEPALEPQEEPAWVSLWRSVAPTAVQRGS